MEYFNLHDINIGLKDKDDESHPYANKLDIDCYETLKGKNIVETSLDEHIYDDAEKQDTVYENTANVTSDPTMRLNTLTRQSVENEYTSFEPRSESTYDTIDRQGKERESEIYSTIPREDEILRPESTIGIYRNLKYVRTKRISCLRRRWKLLLLLAIVLLVAITGVIIAVVLVTNEEETVEFTENFDSPMDTIDGSGSGEGPDGTDAVLTPFDD